METIEYEEPTSWESKGMDWNVPDPRNADYAMAIRNAIMERCAEQPSEYPPSEASSEGGAMRGARQPKAAHTYLPSDIATISPWKTVSVRQMKAVLGACAVSVLATGGTSAKARFDIMLAMEFKSTELLEALQGARGREPHVKTAAPVPPAIGTPAGPAGKERHEFRATQQDLQFDQPS